MRSTTRVVETWRPLRGPLGPNACRNQCTQSVDLSWCRICRLSQAALKLAAARALASSPSEADFVSQLAAARALASSPNEFLFLNAASRGGGFRPDA